MTIMDLKEMKGNFCRLLRSTGRQNVGSVIAELERLGFFEAPASRKDHNSFAGGLLIHAMNVYRVALEIAHDMRCLDPDLEVSDDSLIIASLLHDICKAPRYHHSTQVNGEWQKCYDHLPVGHGEKSVIMLLRLGMEMTDAEILAIRWHMGPWQIALHNEEMQEDYRHATLSCPLVSIIESADKLAAQILEVKPSAPATGPDL